MAQRETREEAQERILELQSALMKRLEANPKYQELDHLSQDQVANHLMPQLFDPKYEIGQLLKSIQLNKFMIVQYNRAAAKYPAESEQWADATQTAKELIRDDLEQIKKIKRGEFEWVI